MLLLSHNGKIKLEFIDNRSIYCHVFSVAAVLKLSQTERHLWNTGHFEYISVQVAVSLTWFIRRLTENYLGFDEQSYKDGKFFM